MEQILLEKILESKGVDEIIVRELGDSISNERFHNRYRQIYLIKEDLIAKRICGPEKEERARNEYNMGNFLFERGINVPQMYWLVNPQLLQECCIVPEKNLHVCNSWFLIMQKINGRELGEISGENRSEAVKQLKEQIAKVLELKIYPSDSIDNRSNSIFDEKERKLYLIDFEYWTREKPNTDELERLKRLIQE
jgi:RIO-like serine/threonine protein kinase